MNYVIQLTLLCLLLIFKKIVSFLKSQRRDNHAQNLDRKWWRTVANWQHTRQQFEHKNNQMRRPRHNRKNKYWQSKQSNKRERRPYLVQQHQIQSLAWRSVLTVPRMPPPCLITVRVSVSVLLSCAWPSLWSSGRDYMENVPRCPLAIVFRGSGQLMDWSANF